MIRNTFNDQFAELFEHLINQVLTLDPATRARLKAHAGASIRVLCLGPLGQTQDFTLILREDRAHLTPVAPLKPTVTLRGAPLDLLALMMERPNHNAEVDGDQSLLLELKALLREARPDIAQAVEPMLGRQAADHLADLVDLGLATGRSLFDALQDTAGDRFRQQAQQRYLTRPEFEALASRLYQLQLAADRLAARADALSTPTAGSQDS